MPLAPPLLLAVEVASLSAAACPLSGARGAASLTPPGRRCSGSCRPTAFLNCGIAGTGTGLFGAAGTAGGGGR